MSTLEKSLPWEESRPCSLDHFHIHELPPPCSHLTEQFGIGLGLHQLRNILGQCVVQLVSLIVSSVINLWDLKYVCKVCVQWEESLGECSVPTFP